MITGVNDETKKKCLLTRHEHAGIAEKQKKNAENYTVMLK